MKKNLHPSFVDCTVTCACGHTFQTKSNKPTHFVETCSACSPAYNPEMSKTAKKTGTVEKFNKKYNLNEVLK